MTPEEWKEGMENEAASVNDAAWAKETRRAIGTGKTAHVVLSFLFTLELLTLCVLAYLFALTSNQMTINSASATLVTAVITAFTFGLAVLMGVMRCYPASVALAFALIPLLWDLITLFGFPIATTRFDLMDLFGLLIRVGVGFAGASLGQFLTARFSRRPM